MFCMGWPLSQDYNEAVQSPERNFADPDLRRGQAATNALGLPMPCSGNFADVYELRCPDGARWAVKCFTRYVAGLRERYREVSAHLGRVRLPFMVDFTFLEAGIRVAGQWYPVLKMPWVEGLALNQFAARSADKPATLLALAQIWGRTARHLRAAQVTHGDLQHGNVLLVRDADTHSLAVKLVDYDGLWVPALAWTKSGEVGHPAYQHPERLRGEVYGPEVDRFPVLLIATALRALQTGGPPLWEKYSDGDNLLFRQQDLEAPTKSRLFYDLLKLNDPTVRLLTDALIEAARKPLDQTPLLEDLLPDTEPVSLITVRPPSRAAVKAVAPEPQAETEGPAADDDSGRFSEAPPRRPPSGEPRERAAPRLATLLRRPWGPVAVAAGVALAVFLVGGGILYLAMRGGSSKPPPLAQKQPLADVDPRPFKRPPPRVPGDDPPKKAGGPLDPPDDGPPPLDGPPGRKFSGGDLLPSPKGPPSGAKKTDSRPPVPQAEALSAAERDIKELYKADYARSGLAEMQALAKRLLRDGSDVKDKPAARYVFLREARDLAATVQDYPLAYQAADEMARDFAVNAHEMKAAALEVAGRISSNTPLGYRVLANGALDLVEKTVADDEYDLATRALAVGRAAAESSKDKDLIARAEQYGDRLAAVKKEFAGLGDTIRTLHERPDDGGANLRLGRFYCFCKGHWERGLPFLARGSDATLQALARQELARPDARRQIADGWWDQIARAEADHKRLIRQHAYQWYLLCLPGRDVLEEGEIDRRLRRLAEDAPGVDGPLDDLDVPRDKIVDGAVRLPPQHELSSRRLYAGPVEVVMAARTAGNNLRLRGPRGSVLVFNWEGKAGDLRVLRPDGNERVESGSLAVSKPCPLTPEEWYVIRWLLTEGGMAVSVNNNLVYKEDRRYDLSTREPIRVASVESPIEVRAFGVKRAK
jgi:hypothetical protein